MARKSKKAAGRTLSQRLAESENSGLIRVAQLEPELEYLFRHALVQEAIHAALLKQDRRDLHRVVGEAIERLYPDRREELAPQLAYHFDLAGDPRASAYHQAAGDSASSRFANKEAISHYRRALATMDSASADIETLRGVFASLGRVFELDSQYGEALKTYEHMQEVARRRGDGPMEVASLTGRAAILSTTNAYMNPHKALELNAEAARLAGETGDHATEARILWTMMLAAVYSGGDLDKAVDYGERSVAIARELGLKEQLAFSLNDLCTVHWARYDFEQAYAIQPQAAALWRELGNLPMLTDNLAGRSHLSAMRSDFTDAAAYAEEAYRISQEIDHRWGLTATRLLLGRIYWEQGLPGKALRTMREAVAIGDELGYGGAMVITRSDLALAYARLGDPAQGIAALDEGLRRIQDNQNFIVSRLRAWLWAARAIVDVAQGNLDAAALDEGRSHDEFTGDLGFIPVTVMVRLAEAECALAQQAHEKAISASDALIQYNQERHLDIHLREALLVKARALAGMGDLSRADATAAQAQSDAEMHQAVWSLWQALALRADFAERSGQPSEARDLRKRAGKIIRDFAEQIEDAALRDSFLAQPRIAQLNQAE